MLIITKSKTAKEAPPTQHIYVEAIKPFADGFSKCPKTQQFFDGMKRLEESILTARIKAEDM